MYGAVDFGLFEEKAVPPPPEKPSSLSEKGERNLVLEAAREIRKILQDSGDPAGDRIMEAPEGNRIKLAIHRVLAEVYGSDYNPANTTEDFLKHPAWQLAISGKELD